MPDTKELIMHQGGDVARAEDFLPLLSVEQAVARKTQINQYIAGIMKEGDDYGAMPGDTRKDAKKVLLKPGAEKLCSVFGLVPQYIAELEVEDWTGELHGHEPLFYYKYRCVLYRGGRPMGEAIGSANSWETKYRYRWVDERTALASGLDVDALVTKGSRRMVFEPLFALDKRETTGPYAKPAEYWDAFQSAITSKTAKYIEGRKLGKREYNGWEMEIDQTSYRIPNPDVADVVNTLQKMAQKRALVAAVLVVTNCSDAFTQDVEDFDHGTASEGPAPIADEPKQNPKKSEPQQQTIDVQAEEAPATKPLPASLAPKFSAWVVSGLNPLIEGLKEVKALLVAKMPQNGADEYKRVLGEHGIKEKGQNDNALLRAALTHLWELQEQIPYQAQAIREYKSFAEAPDAMNVLGPIRVAGVLYEANEGRTAFNKVEESTNGGK